MKLVWEQLGISMFARALIDARGYPVTHQYLITPQMPLAASWQAWYVVPPHSRDLGVFASLEHAQDACSEHFSDRAEQQLN